MDSRAAAQFGWLSKSVDAFRWLAGMVVSSPPTRSGTRLIFAARGGDATAEGARPRRLRGRSDAARWPSDRDHYCADGARSCAVCVGRTRTGAGTGGG